MEILEGRAAAPDAKEMQWWDTMFNKTADAISQLNTYEEYLNKPF